MSLTPRERLIVAADFKPRPELGWGRDEIRSQVLMLAEKLKGTGVCIKVNSVLRAVGYDLIDEIHNRGLSVFADLKLFDIGETLSNDGALLREFAPELLTVVCKAGSSGMKALKGELPDTEVLGVTVLTSLKEEDTLEMFRLPVGALAMKLAMIAETAGLDGLICAPTDVGFIKTVVERNMSYNTPGIRPSWAIVPGDDQNPERIMTPAKAIQAGADRIVVGRPIVLAKDPLEAVMKTLEEIASASV